MKLAPKILALLLCVGIVVRSLLMVWEIFQTRKEVLQQNVELHRVLLSSNVESIATAVYNVEDKRLEVLAASLFELGEISNVWIYEEDGTYYRGYERSTTGFTEITQNPSPSPFEPFGVDNKKPFAAFAPSVSRLISTPFALNGDYHRVISTLWVTVNETPVFAGHIVTDFSHRKADQTILAEIRIKILSGLAFISFLIVVIFIFLKSAVIGRITYLERASSQLATRNFSNYKHDKGHDEIASLNRSFFQMAMELKNHADNLEAIVEERTEELKASRDRVALILENIDQGIVTIDGNLKIEKEFSAFITRFYKLANPEGMDALKTLFPQVSLTADEMDQVRNALFSILETDELCWLANVNKLPTDVSIFIDGQEHHISTDWKAIESEDGIIHKVMLTVRDVTEARKLHKKLAEEETRTKIMIDIIKARQNKSNHELFHALDLMNDKLTPFKSFRSTMPDWANHLLIQLHTVKGESRTIGLRVLSQHIHQVESFVKENQNQAAKAQDQVREVVNLIDTYDQTLDQVFESNHAESSGQPNVLSAISDGLLDLSRRLMEHDIPLQNVVIQDDVNQALNAKAWDDVKSIFMHSMNNVADHGFIHPFKKTGKTRNASLVIRGFVQGDQVHISISDNGAGLNMEKLKEKALQNNMSFDPNAPENVLFLGGISTAESISQTSGRGVGMRAIHDIATALGGRVTLRQNPSGGSILTVILPVSGVAESKQERAV